MLTYSLEENQKANTVKLELIGTIRSEEQGIFETALNELWDIDARYYIFNFTQVDGMGSAAIGKLVHFCREVKKRKADCRPSIKGVNDALYEFFMDIKLFYMIPIKK